MAAWRSWSHLTYNQKTESHECVLSLFFLLIQSSVPVKEWYHHPPGEGLPTSMNAIRIIPRRHTQELICPMIVDLIKLTIKRNIPDKISHWGNANQNYTKILLCRPYDRGTQNQNKFCQRGRGIGVQILSVECEAVQLLGTQNEVHRNQT